MTPEILADTICKSANDAFAKTNGKRSMCIHLPEKVEEAVRRFIKNQPEVATAALIKARSGDTEYLSTLVKDIFLPSDEGPCDDVLCLICRCERMMDESGDGNPWSLNTMQAFLGTEVMMSIKWTNDILKGTIASKKSSEAHKRQATLARGKMFPALLASAAMVHGLQRDLEEAIEARDKYHKLADFLMDGESDPAS